MESIFPIFWMIITFPFWIVFTFVIIIIHIIVNFYFGILVLISFFKLAFFVISFSDFLLDFIPWIINFYEAISENYKIVFNAFNEFGERKNKLAMFLSVPVILFDILIISLFMKKN
tara:strand:+ start:272 stop:619 length:348 start_codon:yes stop_codon:yes gene_type:complete